MAISIKFCGGARTVTGSMHLVLTGLSNCLLDCGLFYGRRDEYYEINPHFPFLPDSLNACVLSHAHIDHCGNIPTLVRKGFRSAIYTTPATRDLCKYMLLDSGFVQEEDIKYVNKINKRRGLPPRQPLYTVNEAKKSLRYFRSLEYHRRFAICKDIDLTFYEAGHILGSAVPLLEIKNAGNPLRVAYAVDLGRPDMPLIRDPESPSKIDYLIIESTYGGKEHGGIKDAETILAGAITRTARRGGKVIIPSFALERTQVVIFFISELIKKNMIDRIPIYVDSPLAVNLTDVFRKNWRYFDDDIQMAFSSDKDPLGYDNITYIKNVNQSKALNDLAGPAIIISASGMCENGRILHHLKNNIENPRNTIVVVGYMAKDTLGRRIVEKEASVRIFGRPYDLKAEVVVINALSSHADKAGLAEYAASCAEGLKGIFIVHGEIGQAEALRENILRRTNIKAIIPSREETFSLS